MDEFCIIMAIPANRVHSNAVHRTGTSDKAKTAAAKAAAAPITRNRRFFPGFWAAMYTAPDIAPRPAALSNQLNVLASPWNNSRAITGSKVVNGISKRLEQASRRIREETCGDRRR